MRLFVRKADCGAFTAQIGFEILSNVFGKTDKEETVGEQQGSLECSVCCSTFDNIFRTPKLLDCTHTFCLECLSRLRTISPAPQVLNGESKHLTCPICRRPTTLPPEGPPALTTNLAVLCQLPRHQQQEEPVWLEGKRLFCKSSKGGSGPESAVCVYIGESKAVGGPLQTNQQYEQMDRSASDLLIYQNSRSKRAAGERSARARFIWLQTQTFYIYICHKIHYCLRQYSQTKNGSRRKMQNNPKPSVQSKSHK
uniref:RING-type domain-containing protein n=1 Tax=Oryzias latipes TaxID=8090 RepID=A0A3P9K7X4_ORYLA